MPNRLLILALLVLGPVLPAAGQAMARAQFVHNAADPSLEVIDIYVEGQRVVDDLAFRTATAFLDVPTEADLAVAVAPGTSTSVEDAYTSFPMTFIPDREYVVVANGVLYPAEFAPNPSGRPIDFRLFVQEHARMQSTLPRQVQLFAVHGVTDLPATNVTRGSGEVLLDDFAYGDVTGYLSLAPLLYVFRFEALGRDDTVLARALAALRDVPGRTGALITSGFADPEANGGGPGLALLLVAVDGSVAELPLWR